jgi:hypothetical protein
VTPAERTALIKAQTSLLDLITGAHKAYVAIGEVLVGGQADDRPKPGPPKERP